MFELVRHPLTRSFLAFDKESRVQMQFKSIGIGLAVPVVVLRAESLDDLETAFLFRRQMKLAGHQGKRVFVVPLAHGEIVSRIVVVQAGGRHERGKQKEKGGLCYNPSESNLPCGGGGIRTLGTGFHPYSGLANRRTRPLCDPSTWQTLMQ